jgi:uncharacterized protein (DUF2336 family)
MLQLGKGNSQNTQPHMACRWRKLEGSDPTTYEMLMKCQALQKRLITTTEACVEKDAQLQEQEKMYAQLKAALARQPGPEAATQISELQVTICISENMS